MATTAAHQFSRRAQASVDLPTDALTGKRDSAKMSLSPELLGQVRERFSDVEPAFRAANGYGFDALTESEARYLAAHRSPESVRSRILAQRDAAQHGLGEAGTREGLNRPLSRALPAPASAPIANASTLRGVAMVHAMAVFTAVRERLPDRTILYFEEVMTGRKTLALPSMRKYPGATDFETINNRVVPSYAQSDAGDVRTVNPKPRGTQAEWEVKDPNAIGAGSVAADATAPTPTTAQRGEEGS